MSSPTRDRAFRGIASLHHQYLCFTWNDHICYFKCLTFGLSSAPRIFTKLLKPVVAHLRQSGVRCLIYLDDVFILNSSRSGVLSDLHFALRLFLKLGFIVNWAKSSLIPSQQLEFLGLMVDSNDSTFILLSAKMITLSTLCSKLLSSVHISLSDLVTIMGHIAWAIPTVPFARAHFRKLQLLYNSQ